MARHKRRPPNPRRVRYATPKRWKLVDEPARLNLPDLRHWMRDMVRWGERVRDDILRLERQGGLRRGDPGDPPPPPE
jgi:hypothetical protein